MFCSVNLKTKQKRSSLLHTLWTACGPYHKMFTICQVQMENKYDLESRVCILVPYCDVCLYIVILYHLHVLFQLTIMPLYMYIFNPSIYHANHPFNLLTYSYISRCVLFTCLISPIIISNSLSSLESCFFTCFIKNTFLTIFWNSFKRVLFPREKWHCMYCNTTRKSFRLLFFIRADTVHGIFIVNNTLC